MFFGAVVGVSGAAESVRAAKSLILMCHLGEMIHMPEVTLVHTKHLLNWGVNGETQWKRLSFSNPTL